MAMCMYQSQFYFIIATESAIKMAKLIFSSIRQHALILMFLKSKVLYLYWFLTLQYDILLHTLRY